MNEIKLKVPNEVMEVRLEIARMADRFNQGLRFWFTEEKSLDECLRLRKMLQDMLLEVEREV